MTAKDGGFFSAEDADSLDSTHGKPGTRGRRVLCLDERRDRRGARRGAAEIFNFHYGVEAERQRAGRQRSARRVSREEYPDPAAHRRGDGEAF